MGRIARRFMCGVAATAVALAVAACTETVDGSATFIGSPGSGASSSQEPPPDPPSDASTSSDAPDSSSSAPTTSEAPPTDSGDPGTVPADFPIPPGATPVIPGNNSLLTVTDPKAAFDFWVGALPAAGYTVTDSTGYGQGEQFIGVIKFTGKGSTDGSVSLLGTTVAIQV